MEIKNKKMTKKERDLEEWILKKFNAMKEELKSINEVIDSEEYGLKRKIHLLYEKLGVLRWDLSEIDLVHFRATYSPGAV